jgi:succinylarginine dihydrolase
MQLIEVQVDRLVGPTHHFGGLGVGNLASQLHRGQVSNPAAAAIQGLEKMRRIASFGAEQVVLPPQRRPDLGLLRSLGFEGSDRDVLQRARDEAPELLSAAMSCSAMWTANAATVTPAVDGKGRSTSLTVANLVASVHRAIEPPQTMSDLRRALPAHVQIFGPIPGYSPLRDEGAANHMRLGTDQNQPGINILVFGDVDPLPSRFWPRQTRAACEAIARRHGLSADNTFLLKQHPSAIDAGAFHNDVVAISHQNLLIHHEMAFLENDDQLARLERRFGDLTGKDLIRLEVSSDVLSIEDAVQSYLFNSQVVSLAGQEPRRVIVCPSQVEKHAGAKAIVTQWCKRGLFERVHFVDLDQSMHGGGGPACLRLRVPVTEQELESLPAASRWTEELDRKLRDAIERFYSDRLTLDDLARADFCDQVVRAGDEIARILQAN